MIDALLETQLI